MPDRKDVYELIDGEREYQEALWGETLSGNRPGDGERSIDEFSLYLVGYADDLLKSASHFSSSHEKLSIIRKLAALAVACMEQHGAPQREMPSALELSRRQSR